MFCSASKENVIDFIRVVNKAIDASGDKFDIDAFVEKTYNNISKATNSHEKAAEYVRMFPSIAMSLIASTNSSGKIKSLIKNDGIAIVDLAKLSVDFSDKTNGWNSVNKYIQDIATSKADAIAIINSTPTEVVSGEDVAVAESENPKVRDAKILNAARKLTVLSTYDREVDDFDSNTINQASAPAFAIKRKILDLLPSAGYNSSKIKYQGVDGFIFKATSSKNIPLDQLRPDQNVEDWANNEGVVILLTDNSGNPIKVDANGDVSDSGKYVYFKIRNTDNINVGSLSARDKENIVALSRAEQIDLPSATAKYIDDINELADIRKEALSGKDVNLIINGGSVGWANNDHKFRNRISSVTNLGNTPILRYDKNNPARGVFDGMAYIKIGGMYGQNVPIERPRINSESEHKDLLINLLTGDLVDSKGKAISSSARAKLVAPFLMVSEKTQEDVESKNRIFFKDNKLVLGLHSFDISKPSSRQLAREELTKFLSEIRPERRIFESEIREYHERLKASDTPSINSVAPLTDSNGGVVMARNESTKKIEALYNVYDVAKMHVNFSLVDKSFKMPELKSIGDNKFEVSTSEQDYNEFIKSNFFINLRLTSDNKAQLTNPYATFERAPISEEVIKEASEGGALEGTTTSSALDPLSSVEATVKALEGVAADKFSLQDGELTPTARGVDYGNITWQQSGLSAFNQGTDGKTYITDKYGSIYQISKTKLSANNTFLVTVKDTKGNEVGSFEFKKNEDGSFSAEEAFTSKEGRGIAAIAYDFASKDGEVIKPSKKLKQDGVRFWSKSISEAYHKAKADDSNSELVEAVEELLGKPTAQEAESKVEVTFDTYAGIAALERNSANITEQVANEVVMPESPEIDAVEQEILDSSNSNNVHEAIVFNIGNYHISQSEIYNLKNVERKGISSDGLSIGDVAKSIKQKNGLKESVAEIEDFIKEYLINGEKDYSYNYDVSRPSSIKRKLSKLRAEYKKVNGVEYVSKLDKAITFDEYIKNTDEQFSNAYQKASGTLASATDVKNAKEWWNKHPLSKTIAFNEAFNIANTIDENNIASFNDYAITLFKGSDSTEVYHEAWHAFTSKFLSDKEKSELYREASKVKGSFNDANGNSVKFSDASDKQLEEYLAEKFRDYAISKNRKGISNKIKAIFDKILRFLNTAFNGYSKPSVTSNPYIKEMFEKLRLGNIRNNTFEVNGTLTEFQKRDVNNRINTYLYEYIVGSNNSNTYSYSENAISESALDYAKSAIQSELQDKRELLVSSGDSNVAKEVNYLSFVLNNWDEVSKEALDLNTAVADGVDSNVNNLVHLAATQSSVYEVMEGVREAFASSSSPTEIEHALNKDTRTKPLMALIGSSNTNAPLEANLFNSFINSFNGLGTNERSVVNTKGFISLANGELMALGKVFSKNIKTSKNEANLISPEYYRLLSIGAGTWTSENEAKYSNQDYSFEPLELTSNGEGLGLYEISSSEDSFTTKNGERVELNSLGVIGKEKLSGNNVITQPISREVATSTEVDGHYKGYRLSNNAESISETELSFNESDVFAEFVNKNFGIANNVDFIDYNEYKSYKIESIIAEKDFAKDFRYEALIDSAKEQLVKEKNESNEAFDKRVEDYAQEMWVRDVALQRSGNKDYMSNSATALLPTILEAFPILKNNTFIKSLNIEDGAINIKNSSLSLSELNEIKQAFYSLENRDVIKAADVAANNAISEYFHSLIDASDINGWNLGIVREAKKEEHISKPIIERLKQTGLANDVKLMTNEQIVNKLKELGVDEDVAKQVAAWHGSPHSFERLLTKGLIQEVEC